MKRKLPPIYVVVDHSGFVWTASASHTPFQCHKVMHRRVEGITAIPFDGDRIMKYVPAPKRPARRRKS